MAYKVRDLILDTLLDLGAYDPVDPLEEEDAAVGLRYVQLMADRFNADRLLLFTEFRVPFVLTANQQTNTLGVGAQFDTTAALGASGPRPTWIGPSTVTPVGDVIDYPLVPYDRRQDYFDEPLKTLADLYPRRFLYEPSWPNGLLTWWPIPTTPATVNLALPAPLTSPATLDTVLTFPPGHLEAWKLNLGLRLHRPYLGTPPDQDFRTDAALALGAVRRLNDDGPPPARSEGAVTGHPVYDIRSSRYR